MHTAKTKKTDAEVNAQILRELRAIRFLVMFPVSLFVGRMIGRFVGENMQPIGEALYSIVSP